MKLKEILEIMPKNTNIYLYNKSETLADGIRYDLNKDFFDLHGEYIIVKFEFFDYNEIGITIDME